MAENLLDVMFAMTKIRCIRLLDIDICSVAVTKTCILLLPFAQVFNMYIECYSLLSILIPRSLLRLSPSIIFLLFRFMIM